ncbi:MAG TPA: DUF1343 domain-containing protein, partial [Verrucomicrobiae bacterium]|nr:DUF1343 domain-containing protein [Verrucomicrobiae bacterium]
GNCLDAAEKSGSRFVVLDRVDPIGARLVEGPVYTGASSFTAYHSIPLRTGMTMGELAKMFQAERFPKANLTVVPVEGWTRGQWFDQTALPWINPSPNMRSLAEATLYPGIGLLETAVSVGRGTDTPFELVGAPYINETKFAEELNHADLPGIHFEPARFTPTASVFKGQACGGARLVLTDHDLLRAVDVGVVIASALHRLYPNDFALEKVSTLLQDGPTLEAIRKGARLADIKALWADGLASFQKRRENYLLYKQIR